MEDYKQKFEKYLNEEYQNAYRAVYRNHLARLTTANRKVYNNEIVRNAIDRCLGVALFIQYFDVPYQYVNRKYEETKAKLEELRNGFVEG